MLILQNITYLHPNKDLLFRDLNLIINKQSKAALIGNNGAGKSTLLKILAGHLQPSSGSVKFTSKPYYVPQLFGQFNAVTIAQALQVEAKLNAFLQILEGNASEENLTLLDDDWAIEERCKEALSHWQLEGFDLNHKMEMLSGGQKTKVFLAGIMIHNPDIVLLDEPSNHLDTQGRNLLYNYIKSTKKTLLVVSHDRTLLNLLDTIYELNKQEIRVYGGNYDFYTEQKSIENNALDHELKSKEKTLRKAKEVERAALERQQKLDARGKRKQEGAGIPKIIMNTLRNSAENSTSKMKGVHAEKVNAITQDLSQLRTSMPDIDKMKIDFSDSNFHRGKTLITATGINFNFDDRQLWKHNLNFQIKSGDRIVLKGLNGSGKTTLIKLILARLEPVSGKIERSDIKSIYIDQDYSLINDAQTVYEQAQQYNSGALQEHEIKLRLNRFLFTKAYWDKPCKVLSGGEKMRLMLCSLAISNQAPDMMVLDEPTNNLDIQNIEILTAAINDYKGTLLVVSHDEHFVKEIHVEDAIYVE